MRRQEAQRRILDLLVQASDQGSLLSDRAMANELGVDRRIVQGNLQLLEEIGYVTLRTQTFIGSGTEMYASLTSKGYVLLHEPAEDPENILPFAKAMLAVMEKQVAGFGELYAPPYLVVQRDEQRRVVAELEGQRVDNSSGQVE